MNNNIGLTGGIAPATMNNNSQKTETFHITWIEAIGGSYLLLKGHYNIRNITKIPLHLNLILEDCFIIDPSWSVECKINLLLPATICIYKGDNISVNNEIKCARARITKVAEPMSKKNKDLIFSQGVEVEIELVDYGNHLKVGCHQLFFPKDPEQLQNIPYTLTNNVLLGVCEEWREEQLAFMREMLCNYSVPACIVDEYKEYNFVTMQWNHFDLTEYLIMQEKFGFHISNSLMLEDFKAKIQQTTFEMERQEKIMQTSPPLKLEKMNDTKTINNVNKNATNDNIFRKNNNNNDNHISNNNTMMNLDNDNHTVNMTADPLIPDISRIAKELNIELNKSTAPMFLNIPRSDPKYLTKRLQFIQNSGQYPNHIDSSVNVPLLSTIQIPNNSLKDKTFDKKQPQQVMVPRVPTQPNFSSSPSSVQSRLNKYSAGAAASFKPSVPQAVGNIRSVMKSVTYQDNLNRTIAAAPSAETMMQNNSSLPKQPPQKQQMNSLAGNSDLEASLTNLKINTNKNTMEVMAPSLSSSSSPSSSSLSSYNSVFEKKAICTNGLQNVQLANRNQPLQQKEAIKSRGTFDLTTLTVGELYDFHICFVENGPYLFCGQLTSRLDELSEMMDRIAERNDLQRLSSKPIVGAPCIAKYLPDSNLYRAMIVNVNEENCKVLYVDYGNADIVKHTDLYEIPMEFFKYKTFAVRFTLSDLKTMGTTMDESLKKIFSDLIIYRNCKLRIMPTESATSYTHLHYCELYIKEKNVLELVKEIQRTRLVYTKAESLESDDQIEIRYIHTPQKFFVQKVTNIKAFHHLMDDMYEYYTRHQSIPKTLLSIGTPCVVETDREWYRARVKEVYKDTGKMLVYHVDFGYEEVVTNDRMSTIALQHLKLPEQAVECCLKGYEGRKEIDDNCTIRLEMMAQEAEKESSRRVFTVKVFRIHPDGVNLVNLYTNTLDVMKRLQMLSVPYNQYMQMEKGKSNIENIHEDRAAGKQQQRAQKKLPLSVLNESAVALPMAPIPTTTTTTTPPPPLVSNMKNHSNNNEAAKSDRCVTGKMVNILLDAQRQKENFLANKQQEPRSQHNQQTQYTLPKFQQERINRPFSNEAINNLKEATDQKRQLNQQFAMIHKVLQQPSKRSKVNLTTNIMGKALISPLKLNEKSKQTTTAMIPGQVNGRDFRSWNTQIPHSTLQIPIEEEVYVSWWCSPHQFYTRLKSVQKDFEHLMSEIQEFYGNMKPKNEDEEVELDDDKESNLKLPILGAMVMARNNTGDNLIYRAKIIGIDQNQNECKFKVYFVDVGNQCTVTLKDLWRIEKRFSTLKTLAHLCSFNDISANYDRDRILNCINDYIPIGVPLYCRYKECSSEGDLSGAQEIYDVDLTMTTNNVDIAQLLYKSGLITCIHKAKDRVKWKLYLLL